MIQIIKEIIRRLQAKYLHSVVTIEFYAAIIFKLFYFILIRMTLII